MRCGHVTGTGHGGYIGNSPASSRPGTSKPPASSPPTPTSTPQTQRGAPDTHRVDRPPESLLRGAFWRDVGERVAVDMDHQHGRRGAGALAAASATHRHFGRRWRCPFHFAIKARPAGDDPADDGQLRRRNDGRRLAGGRAATYSLRSVSLFCDKPVANRWCSGSARTTPTRRHSRPFA